MEDIIEKYKAKKKRKNILIVVTSLFLALGVNFVFSNTQMGSAIKSNIMENNSEFINKSDLFINVKEAGVNNLIQIKNSKIMKDVKSISFSITYNPENIEFIEYIRDNENIEINELRSSNGIKSIIINISNEKDFALGDNILGFIVKKDGESGETINIISANFTDINGEIYELSTSASDIF